MAEPMAKVAITQVQMYRGDELTLFLETGTREERRLVQVDLRITHGGTVELFSNKELHSKPIEQWQPMAQA